MANQPTNQMVRDLLLSVGFQSSELVENNHRVFRHPTSKSLAVLPDNRDNQPARMADIMGLRDYLAGEGYMTEEEFDLKLAERQLRAQQVGSPTM